MIQTRTTLFWVLLTVVFSVNAQNFKFGKVSEQELKETFNPKDSTAAATVLYRSKNIRFDYTKGIGFKVITDVFERIKIYNKAGFDYATISQTLYKDDSDVESISGLKAYTYNLVNGKVEKSKMEKSAVFTTELSKYRKEGKFTLPNIKEGSVIEYQYRITSPFFYSVDEIVLQYDIPIKRQEISFATPEYFNFKPFIKGYLTVAPKYSSKSGSINLTGSIRSTPGGVAPTTTKYINQNIDYKINSTDYNMSDVPALKEEPFVNDMNNYRSAVKYELQYIKFPEQMQKNYTTTWEDVIKNIYKSSDFGGQLTSNKYFDEDLVVLKKSTSSSIDLMAAIFFHVQNRMTWNNIYGYSVDKGVKRAYKERSGNVADINLMLTAMLQEAGLNAKPVLVSTRGHGIPLFPTMEGFNYVIASVEIDGEMILLDATNKYTSPNLLPTRALNWFGKKIEKDGSSVSINLLPSQLSLENVQMNVKLDENGEVKGKFRSTGHYYNAYLFRNTYGSSNEDDYLEKLENRNNGIEISNYLIKNKKGNGKSVQESYEFVLDKQADVVGDKIYFSPLFHLVEAENPFKQEERKYPIDLMFPKRDKYLVIISIPDDYEVISKPADMNIGMMDNMGSFQYKILSGGRQLQLMIDLKLNQAVIGSEHYSSLKEFFKNVVEKQTEKVVLSKITTNGTSDSTGKSR
ncbi:DUF3857 domain-containing protein [Zobellia galactanivorans]|uniref:Conserved hypothetical periplasmic protein n=1 Tax=Zobellia galactanivorans (strain DSM 12802 / CCUG 47099 / CIP 106680 / NCIMB 13871 / Dsij) TaxID=63186 RepID=G0L226_ZOBGA|nr:DUF3857 domain-containing protein [Zobellia galactanivorans]CAZ94886.1 Conserved hypothetical periplasmic protein [Zobellia galactanivorans]